MTHFVSSCKRFLFTRFVFRSAQARKCGVLLLTCSSWLTGIAPGWSGQVLQRGGASPVLAQSANQIRSYAGAVLDIEPLRQNAYRKVKNMMKGIVPNDVCRTGQLPGDVRSICANFFDESADRIRKNNLSIGEFNDITQKSQSDPKLMNQIQQELIRQQR
jgi:Domain of unknown function (DUF4168)